VFQREGEGKGGVERSRSRKKKRRGGIKPVRVRPEKRGQRKGQRRECAEVDFKKNPGKRKK